MRFRLPGKSLLRDFAIMFCGSLLGLFLSKAVVTDSSDQCASVHMVKRKLASGRSSSFGNGGGRGNGGGNHGSRSSSLPWIIWTKGFWNSTGDDGSDMLPADAGWGEEPKDELPPDVEELEMEFEYARPKSSHGNKRPSTSRSWASRNNASIGMSNSTTRRRTLLVGVVTSEPHLQSIMTDVTATWGQGSRDLVFYSLRWPKETGLGVRSGKGSSNQKVQFSKKVRYKRSEGDGIQMVINLDTNRRKKVYPLAGELADILQHLYASQSDLYDWFAVVPDNTYIRLEDIEQLLTEKDSSSYIMLGSPPSGKEAADGWCDDGVGVVLSRTLLSAVGSLFQSVESKGGGSGDDATVASCKMDDYTSFSCLAQKLGVECVHDYQSRHVFKGTDSVLPHIQNSTQYSAHISAPSPGSLYSLHQLFLKHDLEQSVLASNALRTRIARNARELKRRTSR